MPSLLENLPSVTVSEFYGANLISDEEDQTSPQALLGYNVSYIESQVRTRPGFAQVWNPAARITTLYNWLQQAYNRLVYLNRTSGHVISRDLSTGTEVTLMASAAVAFVAAQAAYRIYLAYFDATGAGQSQTFVWDGTFNSGNPNLDAVFQRPLNTSDLTGGGAWGTFAEPATGSVTAGEHNFALVVTTWNGYTTAPGPLDSVSTDLVPATFTSAGGKNLTVQVTPASVWPNWVNRVQLAMTSVANPNRWFLVPNTNMLVARGTNFTVTFTVDFDDTTLVSQGTEITNTLFNLYHQGTNGGGPTNPHFIFSYGNRFIYLTRLVGPDGISVVGTILVSDPNAPQWVTLAYNALNLPEYRDTVTGFALGATMYILGPSWTYAYTDNLKLPVQWSPPRIVDGRIGTPFVKGVSANAAAGYAWVGSHNGLYFFTGQNYSLRPMSYEQTPDWNRINFAAPQDTFKIIDDPNNRQVRVKCALDGATVSTHELVWDYTNGTEIGQVKYCGPHNIGPYATAASAPVYGIGDAEIVQNPTTKINEVWISRGDGAGNVKRQKSIEAGDATNADPSPLYDDDTHGIDSLYKLLAVSEAAQGVMQQIGADFRIRGMGQINLTAFSFDQTTSIPLAPISSSDNSLAPGRRWQRLMDMQSEAAIYQVDNGAAAGAFFYWAVITAYFKPWLRER